MKSFIKLPRRLVQKAVDELLLAWEPNETTEALKTAIAASEEKPCAWMCESIQEDGSIGKQVVFENPEGIRWNDVGEVSPFKVTPLYMFEGSKYDL